MAPRNFRIKIEPEKFYHIWNKGNNNENLFFKADNYEYFLRLYDKNLDPVAETYAFCLLPNHFHLLIRTKQFHQFGETATKNRSNPVSDGLKNLFMAYAQAINVQERRSGSLFRKPFKRLEVDNERYFTNLVHYIHMNPQYHGIVDDFRHYPWSSYERILKSRPSKLKKDEILSWFNSRDNYLEYHTRAPDLNKIRHLIIE